MEDFLKIFEPLDHHGPGTDHDSLWALQQLPEQPQRLLDMGCGPGRTSLLLAEHTDAEVTALDNLAQSLERLRYNAERRGLSDRVFPLNASMTAPPVEPGSQDLIWSECSAYVMGFEQALKQWRPLLREQGYLVISELVWLTDTPDADIAEFWHNEYPDMQGKTERLAQCEQQGYRVLDYRLLDEGAWSAYTDPLARRLDEVQEELAGSQALADLAAEIGILNRAQGQFTYMLMVLKKA